MGGHERSGEGAPTSAKRLGARVEGVKDAAKSVTDSPATQWTKARDAAIYYSIFERLNALHIAAKNMEWMGYCCPNKAALAKVSPEFLKNPAIFLPADIFAKSELIEDVGADLKKYSKVWDEVKAAAK